jgi:hypothetical protein
MPTWWERLAQSRPADFVIGGADDPYLLRWWVIPKNPLVGCYLHCFKRSDDDRALHDHPYLANASVLLRGQYVEHTITAGGIHKREHRKASDFKLRFGPAPHRIELIDGDCWTLFLTGPRVRDWGFYCVDKGWVNWRDFTKAKSPGEIGRGCE